MARQTKEMKQARESTETEETKTAATGKNGDGGSNGSTDGESLAAMIKANEVMLVGLVEMQREVAAFGNARLRQGMETQEALIHCSDLQEAFRLQVDFAQKAMQHYAEETSKLMELSAKVGRECWGPFEDATRVTPQDKATR